MAESTSLLRRRGLISDASWAKRKHPAGTTSERSKLADFSSSTRDEARHMKGVFGKTDSVDGPGNDRGQNVPTGKPTKGGRAGGERNPTKRAHIEAAPLQRPMFPKSKGGGKKWPGRHGGAGQTRGPMYGGPNSRKYSGVTGS